MADYDGNSQFSKKEIAKVADILHASIPETDSWTTEQLVQFIKQNVEQKEREQE